MKKQTAGRDNLGDLAPLFAHLNDDVLFMECKSRDFIMNHTPVLKDTVGIFNQAVNEV